MSTALLLLQDATNHLDDYLIASGLTEGLADISPRWFTLAELEETSVRKALRKMERILLVGSLVDFTHADPLPLESLIRFQGRVPTPLVPIGLRIGALVSPKLKTFLENCGKATDVFSAADA